jgi:YD repeat-containing protein
MYEYNSAGLLTRVIEGNRNEERYTYNDKGEMVSVALNSVPLLLNTFDVSGEITSQTLPDGEKFEYHYTRDPNGRGNAIVPDVIAAPNGLITNIQYEADGYRQWLPVPPQPNK